jgi:hypothetical protein
MFTNVCTSCCRNDRNKQKCSCAVYIGENEVATNSINPAKVQPVDLAARHLRRPSGCTGEQNETCALRNKSICLQSQIMRLLSALATLCRARARSDNKFPVQFALCGLISRSLPFIMQQVIIVPVVLQQKNLISLASRRESERHGVRPMAEGEMEVKCFCLRFSLTPHKLWLSRDRW